MNSSLYPFKKNVYTAKYQYLARTEVLSLSNFIGFSLVPISLLKWDVFGSRAFFFFLDFSLSLIFFDSDYNNGKKISIFFIN